MTIIVSVSEEFILATHASSPPLAETPLAETPLAETPLAETPLAETPLAETPRGNLQNPTPKPAQQEPNGKRSGKPSFKSGFCQGLVFLNFAGGKNSPHQDFIVCVW